VLPQSARSKPCVAVAPGGGISSGGDSLHGGGVSAWTSRAWRRSGSRDGRRGIWSRGPDLGRAGPIWDLAGQLFASAWDWWAVSGRCLCVGDCLGRTTGVLRGASAGTTEGRGCCVCPASAGPGSLRFNHDSSRCRLEFFRC
jgi:hypothetical protein